MKKILILSFVLMAAAMPAWAGSVSGKVAFTGTAPEIKKIDTGADPTCAAHEPDSLKAEDVLVNADGTLKNVFVYVKEGLEGKTFEPSKDKVVLDQKGCHYAPHVFGVQTGQPLEILNSDATLHNVHGMSKVSKEFNLGMPMQGMKLTRKFDKPEVMVKFKCDVHPWMSAYAGVLAHPFFAVTGDTGTFEINNLPPGDYVLEAWHEKFGTQTRKITVTDTGASADFSFAG